VAELLQVWRNTLARDPPRTGLAYVIGRVINPGTEMQTKQALHASVLNVLLVCTVVSTAARADSLQVDRFGSVAPATRLAVHHYEYVFPDGAIYVYDMDNSFNLVKQTSVPTAAGVRGAVASARTGILYISYGSDASNGSMLAYDLRTDSVVWQRDYSFGIDSMSITANGKKIYMPTGELASGGIWEVLRADTGDPIAAIDTDGVGPHNTLISVNGRHVYMGPRGTNYLIVGSVATGKVIGHVGPVQDGVRPFTINRKETLAFITTTGFLGFQVGNIKTGEIIYTVGVQGFPNTGGAASAPSHGITLSRDETELYVVDSINSYVHIFDVSGLPGVAPTQVADVPLQSQLTGVELDCAYDCTRDGWLNRSRDGRYIFVGDSGDVIDTAKHQSIGVLPALANTRNAIEIDFRGTTPIYAMTNRN